MEQERIAHEVEERERNERMRRIQEQFGDSNSQWEQDKSDIESMALRELREKEAQEEALERGPVAQPVKENVLPATTAEAA